MTKDNGGSAFPHQADKEFLTSGVVQYHPGMTLRDYFAAKVMQSLLRMAAPGTGFGKDHEGTNLQFAKASYAVADAMLKAREDHGSTTP